MPPPPFGTDPRVGTVLRGKYRLDRVIGTGGMAVVYKATHRNHAEFAVKMLLPALSLVEEIRSRFLREGYAANAVKHPGAVLVVDDDVAEDGAAFLVMELLDGVPCDRLWGSLGKKVTGEFASAVAIQALDVLVAAHEKGIVHRDIKPANLFLTRAGVVKVLDFGIARAREAITGARATGSGMHLGTPAFMAPEHARGRAREIDGRTDLWAVGATFFSMVSGELVHAAETPNEFLIEAATRPARSLAVVAPDVPARVIEVMDRALEFEKDDRWESARAMRDALLDAHRASFGADAIEEVVANAVRAHLPPPEEAVAPAVETRTSTFGSAREPTERLSTSAAIARDRYSFRPRSPRWALGATVAALVAGLGATAWLKGRPAARGATDAGAAIMVIGSTSAATSAGPPRDLADAQAHAAALGDAPPRASAAPAGAAPLPRVEPRPQPRRAHAADAGPPAAMCSPPWFFDPAGHKQYKPECL
jgi:serine/threonine-protein kinase